MQNIYPLAGRGGRRSFDPFREHWQRLLRSFYQIGAVVFDDDHTSVTAAKVHDIILPSNASTLLTVATMHHTSRYNFTRCMPRSLLEFCI